MVKFDVRMTTQAVSRGVDLSEEMGCGDQDMSYLKSDINRLGDCSWQRGVKGNTWPPGLAEHRVSDGDPGEGHVEFECQEPSKQVSRRQMGLWSQSSERPKWF